MQEQDKQILGKFEGCGELSKQLVRRVQELRKNRGSFPSGIAPVTATGRKPVAEGTPVLGHQHLINSKKKQ